VRVILRVLLEKYRQAGGERRMKCGVRRIVSESGRAERLLLDDGTEVTATHIISTVGAAETERLCEAKSQIPNIKSQTDGGHPVGRLSYCETITVLDRPPSSLGWGDDTIIFFNDSPRFAYEQSSGPVDPRSGVICLPNNFAFPEGQDLPEGLLRCTCLANYDYWTSLPDEAAYQAEKRRWYADIQTSALRFLPPLTAADTLTRATVATDMFTPRTITKFTGHFGGAIYGSPVKIRDGRTPLANVYLAGTDQGFLGIIGAMLSGISMANFHVLAAKS
jgi:phytoene dehydrogenase-like protein